MVEFINFVKTQIELLRKKREKLNFIQIGAYDGVSFGDMANITLLPSDTGIFIEPNIRIFEKLKENKNSYEDSIFLNLAIIPNKDFYHDVFFVDRSGGQSTFVKNVYNEKIHEVVNVVTLTVDELFNNHVNFDVDIVYLDCEGFDHDIIINMLKIQEPEIIYFESWNTVNLNNQMNENILTTREEIIQILTEKKYTIEFEPKEENIIAFKNG